MFQFNIKDCRLNIHFSLFVLIAFCNLVSGFKNGILMLIAIVMHESAHLCVMVITKNPPDCIHLTGLGMRIILPKGRQLSYQHNMAISLAGPLINIICGSVSLLTGFEQFGLINLALGLFHILPIEPLDGGLALRALLSARMEARKAEKITLGISLLFIIPIMILGFTFLLETRNNFTLLALSIYLMLYLILKER